MLTLDFFSALEGKTPEFMSAGHIESERAALYICHVEVGIRLM